MDALDAERRHLPSRPARRPGAAARRSSGCRRSRCVELALRHAEQAGELRALRACRRSTSFGIAQIDWRRHARREDQAVAVEDAAAARRQLERAARSGSRPASGRTPSRRSARRRRGRAARRSRGRPAQPGTSSATAACATPAAGWSNSGRCARWSPRAAPSMERPTGSCAGAPAGLPTDRAAAHGVCLSAPMRRARAHVLGDRRRRGPHRELVARGLLDPQRRRLACFSAFSRSCSLSSRRSSLRARSSSVNRRRDVVRNAHQVDAAAEQHEQQQRSGGSCAPLARRASGRRRCGSRRLAKRRVGALGDPHHGRACARIGAHLGLAGLDAGDRAQPRSASAARTARGGRPRRGSRAR